MYIFNNKIKIISKSAIIKYEIASTIIHERTRQRLSLLAIKFLAPILWQEILITFLALIEALKHWENKLKTVVLFICWSFRWKDKQIVYRTSLCSHHWNLCMSTRHFLSLLSPLSALGCNNKNLHAKHTRSRTLEYVVHLELILKSLRSSQNWIFPCFF